MEELFKNIKSGLKLAFGRFVCRSDFTVSTSQLFILIALTIGLSILQFKYTDEYDYYFSGLSGLTIFLALTLGGYLLSLLFVTLIWGIKKWQELLVISFSSNLILSVLNFYTLIESNSYSTDDSIIFTIFFLFIPLFLILFSVYITYRCFRLVYEKSRMKCAIASSFIIGLTICLFFTYTFKDFLFIDHSEIDYSEYESEYESEISIEDTYYNQAHLLEKQISILQTEDPAKIDLFLINFASYAHQDVFKKEVRFVSNTITQRFKNTAQSVELINHLETVEDVPLANKPNLKTLLNGIKNKMDTEQDIVMLYLTSHGSQEGELSASFDFIEPEPIDAKALREVLDVSQIKWRIVFVSACFSGTFIDPLKTDHSLIITASSKDKSSFGCSHERDLTYFAEAYFKEALPKSTSLINAFSEAKKWVTAKELSEDKDPSQPQMFIGSEMKKYITEFEAQ